MKKIVFFNNKYINSKNAFISYEDRGFQFADSIYEVIAFINNNFIDLDFHLRRLRRSLKLIDIKYSFNKKNLQKIFKKLIKINKNKKGLIYLQISRGVQPRNHSYNISGFKMEKKRYKISISFTKCFGCKSCF